MAKKFDLEEFKERLFISVVNYFENKDILNNVPHEVKGDFALIPRVCLGNKNDAGNAGQKNDAQSAGISCHRLSAGA